MSRKYQPKTKEYATVTVVSSDQIYDKDGKVKKGVDVVGKIDRDLPNIITTVKRRNGKTKFVEDTCNLTKKTKGEIVDFFKCVFSCAVLNGYGMTETAGGTCCSSSLDVQTVGHCGGPVCGIEGKLVSVPEKNYFVTDRIHYRSAGISTSSR